MPNISRSATAIWTGDLKSGSGSASTESGYLKDVKITWSSRFESNPGSNPEELIAAAHAACFAMSISSNLTRQNTPPKEIHAKATLTMRRDDSGTKLTKMHLAVEASVPGIDEAAFKTIAEKAKETCPISMLLKPGLEEITLDAKLIA
jgi:lipoyl-dependent peroxiredoxin